MGTDAQPTGHRVDTWEMVVIHKWFRREFRQLPELVRSVAGGDRARAEIIGKHIDTMTHNLHHHHTSEDELLWPKLLDRAGTLDHEMVQRMEAQHEVVSTLLDRVGLLAPKWRAAADRETGNELATVLAEVSIALEEHLGDEEKEVLPLVSIFITQAEWEELGKRGVDSMPKGAAGFVILGMILQDATEAERVRFMDMLPAPVRFLYKLVGTGIHRRAKTRLYGAAA